MSTQETIPMHSTPAIEWAEFSLRPGIGEDQLLAAAQAMQQQFLQRQSGYLSRELVALGQGRYADLLHWQSREAADAALAQAARCPACAAYFGLMQVERPPAVGRPLLGRSGAAAPVQGMEFSLFRLRPGASEQALASAARRMADGLYRGEPGFLDHMVVRSADGADTGLYADVVLADSARRARHLCGKWGQGPFDPACLEYLELIAPESVRLQFWDRVA